MKKHFTEQQIIGVLKKADAGMKAAELCNKHGVSDATYTTRRPNLKASRYRRRID
jgi:putative transposase